MVVDETEGVLRVSKRNFFKHLGNRARPMVELALFVELIKLRRCFLNEIIRWLLGGCHGHLHKSPAGTQDLHDRVPTVDGLGIRSAPIDNPQPKPSFAHIGSRNAHIGSVEAESK